MVCVGCSSKTDTWRDLTSKQTPFIIGQNKGGVPLNSSVLLFNEWDYDRCPDLMSKAIALGNRTVNVVASIGFQADENREVTGFCFQRLDSYCHKMSGELVDLISAKLKICMQVAELSGINISFVPHIDYAFRTKGMTKNRRGRLHGLEGDCAGNYRGDGDPSYWRNTAVFDPSVEYQGFSYERSLLRPLLESVDGILSSGHRVQMSLQGEMGATTFACPTSYIQIINKYKKIVSKAKLELGLGLNFNKVNGRLVNYSQAKVQKLFDAVDFIGISAYKSVSIPPKPGDFQSIVDSFISELGKLGIKENPKMPLHFSEIGIGGGDSNQSGNMAGDLRELARSPWSGVKGEYSDKNNPWLVPEYQDFRRKYFDGLVGFLATPAKKYKVVATFIWNTGSWDVQGIYSEVPRFSDEEVVGSIRKYNESLRKD